MSENGFCIYITQSGSIVCVRFHEWTGGGQRRTSCGQKSAIGHRNTYEPIRLQLVGLVFDGKKLRRVLDNRGDLTGRRLVQQQVATGIEFDRGFDIGPVG